MAQPLGALHVVNLAPEHRGEREGGGGKDKGLQVVVVMRWDGVVCSWSRGRGLRVLMVQ